VFRFSDEALSDLRQIRRWLALENPRMAADKSAMLVRTCEMVGRFPGMRTLYSGQFRRFTKEVWIILYSRIDTGVFIHRVFDSRQDWRAQINSEMD